MQSGLRMTRLANCLFNPKACLASIVISPSTSKPARTPTSDSKVRFRPSKSPNRADPPPCTLQAKPPKLTCGFRRICAHCCAFSHSYVRRPPVRSPHSRASCRRTWHAGTGKWLGFTVRYAIPAWVDRPFPVGCSRRADTFEMWDQPNLPYGQD